MPGVGRKINAWDQQRGAPVRIKTDMWVRVIGRDGDPTRRTGDICASGFFFGAEDWIGRPGDICVMEVSSEDLEHSFTTMASLVRTVDVEDARYGSGTPGVSYQFLPSDEATRADIARTVRHIAEQHPEQSGDLVPEEFQEAAAAGAYPGASESGHPSVETGAHVRLVVESPTDGSKREVEGVVGDIAESVQADGKTRFWVPVFLVEELGELEVEREGAGDEVGSAVSEEITSEPTPTAPVLDEPAEKLSLLDRMWKELVPEARSIIEERDVSASPPGKSHLSGKLSQISMPTRYGSSTRSACPASSSSVEMERGSSCSSARAG